MNTAAMTTTRTFSLFLPARPESLTVVRHVLGGLAEDRPIDPELLDDVRIAVTEACSTAITHGGPGMLEIRGEEDDGHLVLAVRSRSGAIDPRPDSPDLGLSLPLIGALTTRLEIGELSDGTHEVRMTFPRTSA